MADSRSRASLFLALGWGVLIIALCGAVGVHALLRPAAAPPAEPFFVALEPYEPPPPPEPEPAIAQAEPELPALPETVETPAIVSRPPAAPTATPRAPAPAPQSEQLAATGGAPAAVRPAPSGPLLTWQRFATPFDADEARPRIAVVIVELGLSGAATEAAIQHLPPGVTLGFSPYAENLDQAINLARAAGHETLLGLPMEPANFPARDPGPRTLLTSLTPRQNLDRLEWVLGRVTGYVGVTNMMGSRFTVSADALRPVLSVLRDRGLMFLDARTSPRSVAGGLATSLGLPRAINDRLVDQEASRAAIDNQFAEIEKTASETGAAVAMGQPYPVTFERLNAWLPTLDAKGFVLAPITALVNRQIDAGATQ